MSSTYQPTGLQAQGKRNNDTYEGGTTTYPLTTNAAVVIAHGDPVALVAGSIAPVVANPAAGTLSANSPIGVVNGFEYQDVNRGFVCSDILPANAVSAGFISQIKVLVYDNQFARFTVQANGSIPASALGCLIGLGGFGAASVPFKVSRVFADLATLVITGGTGTSPLRIVGFDQDTQNAPGDAFTKILVSWNANTHYYDLTGAH